MSREHHMASDYSSVKELGVSVHNWTAAQKPPKELEIAAVWHAEDQACTVLSPNFQRTVCELVKGNG